MSNNLIRQYIDIINENQNSEILTEGLIQNLVDTVKRKLSSIPDNLQKKIADFVSQTLGKSVEELSMSDVTIANAKKLVAANTTSEADQNISWQNSRDKTGREYAIVPGSLEKEKTQQTALGGTLGAIAGFIGGGMMAGVGLPAAIAAGAVAIIIAILFRSSATGNVVPTGKFRSGRKDYYDPNERNPELGPASDELTNLPVTNLTRY